MKLSGKSVRCVRLREQYMGATVILNVQRIAISTSFSYNKESYSI